MTHRLTGVKRRATSVAKKRKLHTFYLMWESTQLLSHGRQRFTFDTLGHFTFHTWYLLQTSPVACDTNIFVAITGTRDIVTWWAKVHLSGPDWECIIAIGMSYSRRGVLAATLLSLLHLISLDLGTSADLFKFILILELIFQVTLQPPLQNVTQQRTRWGKLSFVFVQI